MTPDRRLFEVRPRRRRRAGPLPPARRRLGLHGPGAHGPALLDGSDAGRRPGQLRLGRRRYARLDAIHRGPHGPGRPRPCWPTSTRTRSISSRTTTRRSWSPSSCRRGSRTCWSTARAASPSAWPPTSRRITWARSSTPAVALLDDPRHLRSTPCWTSCRARTSRPAARSWAAPRRATRCATAAARSMVRGKATIETIRKDREAIVVTELPFQVNKQTLIERIAEMVREKRIEGISDVRDEMRPPGHADGHRAEARRVRRRDPEPAVALHRHADARSASTCWR